MESANLATLERPCCMTAVSGRAETLHCLTCSDEFEFTRLPKQRGPKPKYCSSQCKQVRYGLRYEKKCPQCKVSFHDSCERGVYCSKKCGQRAHQESLHPTYYCRHCGKPCRPAHNKQNVFCSRRCCGLGKVARNIVRILLTRELRLLDKPLIECKVCFKPFRSRHNALCCSKRCSRVAWYQYKSNRDRAERNSKPTPICKCLWCGVVFTAEIHREYKYCSARCSKRANKRARKFNKAANKRMREAAVITGERINPYKVYLRDRGVCGLCGCRVSRKDVGIWSFTVDHITPVSKGGEHRYCNVQTAHMYCNTIKNDSESVLWIEWIDRPES